MNSINYSSIFSIILASLLFASNVNSTEIDIGYDSKYVSEGRNNLIDGGIVWLSGNTELSENFSLGFAYGNASSSMVDYDELNVGVEYSNSVGDLDYYLGYTRLEFYEDEESDNEFGFGVAWNGFGSYTPFANFVYSSEAEGSFFEFGAETEIIINEQFNITPYIVFTFDYGYASEENDSHNHTGIGASFSYALTENVAVSVIAEHTIGGFDVKEEGSEHKQTWTGVHITMAF